ncbi:MAG: efflux RND transporter permease subunit [Gloeomargaritaceae cyanobacterium C42_A2020_066]|nr:efflux RND transporter permease subunit [Gloeomargaritaceae cyanobacterium C42_A2020_066]
MAWSVSTLAVRRRVGTLMLTLAAVVLGVVAILGLEVDLLPAVIYPRIAVRLTLPGVAPDAVVETVTRPLEEALLATEGVEQIFSTTRPDGLSVDLYFPAGSNLDRALTDTTASFNRVRARLPDWLEPPRIFRFDPSQSPIYEFALTSGDLPSRDLRTYADQELVRVLSLVPGVAAVQVAGGQREEVQVYLDLNRLQASGLGINTILTALAAQNQDVGGGRLENPAQDVPTRVLGRWASADQIRDVRLEVPGTSPPQTLSLGDVAQVIDGEERPRLWVALDGRPAVRVSILKQPQANTVAVVTGVQRALAELTAAGRLPPQTTLVTTLDEARFIRSALANVISSGISGAILAALVVFVFLGSLRQALVVVIAIPLSTLVTLALMDRFGLSLNLFSLGGLALGVGIVVDNTIVMVEVIAAGQRAFPGLPPERQVIRAARPVESALVASTFTNLASVVPFLGLAGLLALLFSPLILTVSLAVTASLVVALTVVPVMMVILGVDEPPDRGWAVAVQRWLDRLEIQYQRALVWSLNHAWLVVGLIVVTFGASAWFAVGGLGQTLIPRINTGLAQVSARFPPGIPLAVNRRVMTLVGETLGQFPETQHHFTVAGGNLFGATAATNPQNGNATLTLKPQTPLEDYVERATTALNALNLAGIRLTVIPEGVRGIILTNSPVQGGDLDVVLQGDDADSLQAAGRQVLARLSEQVPDARFRTTGEDEDQEVQIKPDSERLATLGLSVEAVGQVVSTALQGTVPTQLQRGDRLVDVRVQVDPSQLTRSADLALLPVTVPNQQPVRIGDLATLSPGRAPTTIQRLNQKRIFLINGSLAKGVTVNQGLRQVDAALAGLKLPQGVTLLPSQTAAVLRQLQGNFWVLGGLGTFLVFVVMAVQYNTLLDPLIILVTVPLALAGGILGLAMTETPLSATVIVGAVLLVGIVVNNAILLVEIANQTHTALGVDWRTAMAKAAPQRLRPILMTTLTTVIGLSPLALGGGEGLELLRPIGLVIFSGLSLATLLTLFLIPCLYTLAHEKLSPRPAAMPTGTRHRD